MNLSSTQITDQLNNGLVFAKRYRVIIFIVVLVTIYSFLIFKINTLSNQQPVADDVNTQLQTLSTPRIDQSSIDKIKQLQDNSVEVKTLFNSARKSPFNE